MKIGIVGCGMMGGAIARKLAKKHSLILFDKHQKSVEGLAKELSASVGLSLKEIASKAEVIILAVKPKDLDKVAKELPLSSKQLLISVLAGTSLAMLRSAFPSCMRLRIMPNLALTYDQGLIGAVDDSLLSANWKKKVEPLLNQLGHVKWMPEEQIEAFAALAASAPAFLFLMVEGMIEGGVAMGFTAKEAQEITIQMMAGTVAILKDSKKHPAELKMAVASPKGTTIRGLIALEKGKVKASVIQALLDTLQRSEELLSR